MHFRRFRVAPNITILSVLTETGPLQGVLSKVFYEAAQK